MADDLPPLQCRNAQKIRGLNPPGTPWATSACCGRPLPLTLHPNTVQLPSKRDFAFSQSSIVYSINHVLYDQCASDVTGTVWAKHVLYDQCASGVTATAWTIHILYVSFKIMHPIVLDYTIRNKQITIKHKLIK